MLCMLCTALVFVFSGRDTYADEIRERIKEEEEAVKQLAESYVKVYAPFSTIKDIGDLRSRVLALIKNDCLVT